MTPIIKHFLLLILMVAASGLAIAMRPTHKIAEMGPAVKLESMIPESFGEWREEKQNQALIVDPQQKEMIDLIYAQTLSRTYVNPEGYRIMLSIAYGSDQSDAKQVYKPEICYPAQGFTLKNKQYGQLVLQNTTIPVTRIETSLGERNEPVTYWITVGDRVVGPGLNKKLVEMGFGLRGLIPDGLLFRLSSIDSDTDRAYEKQNAFAGDLLGSLRPEDRQKLIGNSTREQQ
jgi:EpsI family protein